MEGPCWQRYSVRLVAVLATVVMFFGTNLASSSPISAAGVMCPDGSKPYYYDPNRGIDCPTFSSSPQPPGNAARPVQSHWVDATVDNGEKDGNGACVVYPDLANPNEADFNPTGRYHSYTRYWGWSYTDAHGVGFYGLGADGSAIPYTIVGSANIVGDCANWGE